MLQQFRTICTRIDDNDVSRCTVDIPLRVYSVLKSHKYTPWGINDKKIVDLYPIGCYHANMSKISEYVKKQRKLLGLTQEEFAIRSGLGLRFVRELEQGKKTVRLDKVNQALAMFGMEVVPGRIDHEDGEF